MGKFIYAAIVAIAMFVGVQPVSAEQFIAPEISVSNDQCYVLDVPAGVATVETSEYTAPWQVPETQATTGIFDYWDFDTGSSQKYHDFTSSTAISYFIVTVYNSGNSSLSYSIQERGGTGNLIASHNGLGVDAGDTETFPESGSQTAASNSVKKIRVYVSAYSTGRVTVSAW